LILDKSAVRLVGQRGAGGQLGAALRAGQVVVEAGDEGLAEVELSAFGVPTAASGRRGRGSY